MTSDIDEQAVCSAYSEMSTRQVQAKFNIGWSTLCRILDRHRIPRRCTGWGGKAGYVPRQQRPISDLSGDDKIRAATAKLVQRMRKFEPGRYA